eukprot:TRINITY_DN59804_c0_g1_i1.p1 TRINITY_DN59804_c0_g1~~TRINITY_DN59804_c0_g1_i1.p1  ORF type:complete len:437 (+),score=10.98 TRINITY_DN59804_c0_g1_i1:31-1341(+)
MALLAQASEADPLRERLADKTHRRLLFQSPVPVHNKSVFVLTADITRPIREIKELLHSREKFETSVDDLAFFIDGIELDDTLSLSSYQSLTHKSIIAVRGACYQFTVTTAVVEHTIPVKWTKHMTVTEMVRVVWRKTGINLDCARFRVNGQPIPHENCYKYKEKELAWNTTVLDLGLAASLTDMVTVKFCRFKKGKPMYIPISVSGEETVLAVHNKVKEWEAQTLSQKKDAQGVGGGGWISSVLAQKYPNTSIEDQLAAQEDDFDDEHESVSPLGNKRVFLYRPGIKQYVKSDQLHPTESYFCYHPIEGEAPTWVDIDMDFSVKHLSDSNVFPGSTVDLDFYSSFYNLWSADVKLKEYENAELLSIKTLYGHVIRLYASMDEPVEDVLLRLWCATGDTPQSVRLETDDGRPLPEWKSLNDVGVLAETMLACRKHLA